MLVLTRPGFKEAWLPQEAVHRKRESPDPSLAIPAVPLPQRVDIIRQKLGSRQRKEEYQRRWLATGELIAQKPQGDWATQTGKLTWLITPLHASDRKDLHTPNPLTSPIHRLQGNWPADPHPMEPQDFPCHMHTVSFLQRDLELHLFWLKNNSTSRDACPLSFISTSSPSILI